MATFSEGGDYMKTNHFPQVHQGHPGGEGKGEGTPSESGIFFRSQIFKLTTLRRGMGLKCHKNT